MTGLEQLGGHVVERLVAQDAGVVDDDVDRAERVERGLHDGLAALGGGHAVGVGDGLAAEAVDLLDDLLRPGPRRRPSPSTEPPRSLTTTAGAAAGELEGV